MLRILALGHTISFAAALCYDGGGGFTSANWPQCVEAADNISVYSGLSADGQFLKLGLHAKHTKGWSAVGFSGNGGMKGASQIVVRISETTGDWIAEDRYSLDYVTPTLDEQQDVKLIFASDNGVNTSWGVLIPKDSCDVDDYSIENVSRTLLWALGGSHSFGQHTSRGQFHANVVNGKVPFAPLVGVTEASFRMNSTVVSASSDATNPYICHIFDLREVIPNKNLTNKVHVAKFSPYLDPITSGFVHHMILYGCASNTGYSHGDVISDCESMPDGCNIFKWVWAVGSQDIQLPDNVGMPLGEGLYFVALQMHYYNPALINVVDTSGVTVSIVDNLRPIDAGIFQLNGGTSPSMRLGPLPAGQPTFTLEPPLIVPSICTEQWESPINVVGAVHHMHLLGVNQKIEVARNNSYLGLLRSERVYDFQHQSLEETIIPVLYPGDSIKVTCQYNTQKKNVTTQFGENTDDEMCWAALMYYPAQSFFTTAIQPPILLAETCPQVSTQFAAQNISLCAEKYLSVPLHFLGMLYPAVDALYLCNTVSQDPDTFAAVTRGVNICPPCHGDGSCTEQNLLAYAQGGVCQVFCNAQNMSVYPDQSRPIPPPPQIRTYCDGPTQMVHAFTNTFPSPPQCVARGSLANATAVAAVESSILVTQTACPNGAIKDMLAACSPADFEGDSLCGAKCRNATRIFSEKAEAMSATGEKLFQCVKDYNATWGPTSEDGSVWTMWGNLETRVKAGSAICESISSDAAPSQYFLALVFPLCVLFLR